MSGRKSKGSKGSSRAWAICDRTGARFPMSEMVYESGTNYLVHRSVDDGRYNFVDHPQAHINEFAKFGDPFPVADARPDINWSVDLALEDLNGSDLVDLAGNTLD